VPQRQDQAVKGRLFAEARAAGLHPVHVPIDDFGPPTAEALEECLDAIDRHAPTLVHCHAGLGRTGTVCAAWLALRLGIAVADAIRIVRALRPGSIESEPQVAFLRGLAGREAFAPPAGEEVPLRRAPSSGAQTTRFLAGGFWAAGNMAPESLRGARAS
jgi:protein-tyrosine phosphatase